ncbi:YitT family protein, partial [Enterococcus faecalis]|uniref:YitT family protein n=1 Tax=Enterococcus faecalis TaxID=1351 RepID=UPI003CC6AF78
MSVSIVYAILASIGMNFFYQRGNIYSSGLSGFAQIFSTLSTKIVGFNVPDTNT